jgi:tellurite resistance protein
MFFADFDQRNGGTNRFGYVAQPGPRIMECMIVAAAEMALADGRAQPVEYRGLLSFLKRTNIRVAFSRGTVLERFSTEISRIAIRERFAAAHQEVEWQDLTDRLRPLAGMETARLIAGAAAHVAEADGILHPREIDLLNAMRNILEIAATPSVASPVRGLSPHPVRPDR